MHAQWLCLIRDGVSKEIIFRRFIFIILPILSKVVQFSSMESKFSEACCLRCWTKRGCELISGLMENEWINFADALSRFHIKFASET